MTFKRGLSFALICTILLSIAGTVAAPHRAEAARPHDIPIFAAPGKRDVTAGDQQTIYVHTIAMAHVTLKVDYGNGQVYTQDGASDTAGVHQFVWTVDYAGSGANVARYWVYVTRDTLYTSLRGTFLAFPPDPFGLDIALFTPRLHPGDTFQGTVYTRPLAQVSVHVRDGNGVDLLALAGQADATGQWPVSAPIRATASRDEQLHVIVSAAFYGRHHQMMRSLLLQPRSTPQTSGGSPQPAPGSSSASLAAARQRAIAAAGGSYALAQANARTAVQTIVVDLQVLGQWRSLADLRAPGYYQGLLSRAASYNDYIETTAQALVDNGRVQALMRAVMPHKAVMVSIAEQALRAYEDGQLKMFTYVTTGRPELPTVTGHYAIYTKISPFQFISPWPKGSPYYYAPTWIKYWMPFYSGYGLHDAWWRNTYGPGTNVYGDGPNAAEPTGTHGCVNIPFNNTVWLWNWAPVGTPVVVYGGPSVKAGAAGI